MRSRDEFEEFVDGLATRRRRGQAMSCSLQRHAAERFAALRAADRYPGRIAGIEPVYLTDRVGRDDWLGAVLFSEATALADATLEDLDAAERELLEQNGALFDARIHLDERARHFHDLFELAPAAYVVTDGSGAIREVNRDGAALFGHPRNFLVGRPLASFVGEESERASFRVALRRVQEGTDVEVWQVRLARSSGPAAVVTVSVRPVRDGGGALTSLHWLFRDDTGRIEDDLL